MKETRLLNITKSLVVILTLSLILTPNPNAPAAPKSRAIKLSSVGGRRAKPGIVKGGKMRLAGQHTFTVTNGKKVTWTLDREEANEEGGTPTLLKNVASAKGATAIFDLTKTSDKELSITCARRAITSAIRSACKSSRPISVRPSPTGA